MKVIRNYQTSLGLRKLAKAIQTKEADNIAIDRLIAYKALRKLRSSKSNYLILLQIFLKLKINQLIRHPKYILLKGIIQPNEIKTLEDQQIIKWAILETASYKQSIQETIYKKWAYKFRITDSEELLQKIKLNNPEKIFFFHHYDRLGYFPQSWLSSLEAIYQQGWTVIVSSSYLSQTATKELEERNIIISLRKNIGICIGAYKDFNMNILNDKDIMKKCKKLILANDSTLPISGTSKFEECIGRLSTKLEARIPLLTGITDSVQTDAFHLQSYLLGLNNYLLNHDEWKIFWNTLSITDNKDEAINSGEIGLTLHLVNNGIRTWTMYPMIDLLLDQKDIEHETNGLGVSKINTLNPSIYTWKSLLNAGCPLVKKYVLFEFPQLPIPISQLKQWNINYDYEIRTDLHQLIKSKFHSISKIPDPKPIKYSLFRRAIEKAKRILKKFIAYKNQ